VLPCLIGPPRLGLASPLLQALQVGAAAWGLFVNQTKANLAAYSGAYKITTCTPDVASNCGGNGARPAGGGVAGRGGGPIAPKLQQHVGPPNRACHQGSPCLDATTVPRRASGSGP
jgi:hypothetical protein